MSLRENLKQTREYQELTDTPDSNTAADDTEPRRVETTEAAVAPIISLERGDVQFWLQVIQVLLLYLILRELGRA